MGKAGTKRGVMKLKQAKIIMYGESELQREH